MLLSTLIRVVRRACARGGVAAALVAAAWLVPAPAVAQTWSGGGCTGCHGTVPTIASSVTNGLCGANYTLGLGESWMSSASALLARAHAVGQAAPTGCGIAAMNSTNFTDATSVYAYFLSLRDGDAAAGTTPAIGSSKVGTAKDIAFSFTLTNFRNAATSFDVDVSGGNATAGEYTVTAFSASGGACSGSTLPAAATEAGVACTISGTVRFTPSTTGSRTTSLVVSLTSSPAGTAQTVYALSGTGLRPVLAVSPTSATLSAKVGSSAQQTFTVSNTGSVVMDLTSIGVSPTPPYTLSTDCSTAGTSNLAAGADCLATVTFTPTAAGAVSGTLSIGHDAGNVGTPRTITINGTGTVPVVSPTVPSTDLGSSQFGVPKVQAAAITLSNTGNATLVFPANPFTVTGTNPGDFAFSGCGGQTINPGGSCSITATFTPGGVGPRSASLAIASDASNGTVGLVFTGTGSVLPEPTVTPQASITAFPDTVIGEVQATTRDIVIRNDRVRDIGYGVANTTSFRVKSRTAGACAGGTVPGGGGSCTLTFEFAPPLAGGAGTRQETLTFDFTGTGGDASPGSVLRQLSGVARLPVVLSASTLSPNARVTLPSTSTSMAVTNHGSGAVTIGSIAFSGAAAGDYGIAAASGCQNGTVLSASGGTCTLVLRFDPAAAGSRNATMTITHTALNSPQTVSILGTAGQAPQGRLELSATSVAFADTQLQSSSAQTLTLSNAGDLALNFSGFTLAGTNPGDFARGGTCAVGTPVAIGGSCTMQVDFAPTALGARSASLRIDSDSSTGPVTLVLSGTGVPIPVPAVGLAPASLDFGAQTVGGLYPARTVRLTNTGTADLAIASIAIAGSGYVATPACPSTLAPAAGCDILVQFAPGAAGGPVEANLRVTSNAAGSPHDVALTGTGSSAALPVLVWSPVVTSLAFGNVSAGTLSAEQTVVLSNQGPGGVTIALRNAIGPDAPSFVVSGGSCTVGLVLFEGQTCTVGVRFAPASAGARSATLQVATNGSFPPPLGLTGTGLGGPTPAAALSASALAFEATRVGSQSLPGELTIASSGSGTLQVTAIELTGPYAMQLRSCPPLPFTLEAGAGCTVAVSFLPQQPGSAAGTMRILSNASATALEVSLSGSGEARADLSDGGGGCSLVERADAADPTLWLLVALAAAVLVARRRRGGA